MNKESFEVVINESSRKRLVYSLSTRYLLARAVHVAAEFNLGKIITNEPKDFESIYSAIINNIIMVQKDYLLRLLKFLSQFRVLDMNNNGKFLSNALTSFLIDQNNELMTNQSEWCRSGDFLDFLSNSTDIDKLLRLEMDTKLKDLKLEIRSNPYSIAYLFSKFHLISRALHTIAQINLISFVSKDRKVNSIDLVKSLGISQEKLLKLMNFLMLFKLIKKSDDTFRLSKVLYSVLGDSAETIQPAFCMVNDAWWNSVSELKHTLVTRQSAFEKANKVNFFKYLETHTDEQRKFDIGLGCFSKFDDENVASHFSFSSYKSIVDIGGGYGGLLWAIHERDGKNVHELSLYDQPHVVLNSHPGLTQLKANEFQRSPGNFLEKSENTQIPKDKSLYVIKGVLHDFSDEQCLLALKNIHDAMSDESQLLVVERSLRSDPALNSNYTSDILMLILLDGRERSMEEWLQLYKMCGFYCNNAQTSPIAGDFSLMLCSKQRMFAKTQSADHDPQPTSESTNEYSIHNN